MSAVIEITATKQLPVTRMRMESAPDHATAKLWADKIGRTVYWYAKNQTAYAEIGLVENGEK